MSTELAYTHCEAPQQRPPFSTYPDLIVEVGANMVHVAAERLRLAGGGVSLRHQDRDAPLVLGVGEHVARGAGSTAHRRHLIVAADRAQVRGVLHRVRVELSSAGKGTIEIFQT